jgi:hypothetical protein
MLVTIVAVLALVAITIGSIATLVIWKKKQKGKSPKINYLVFFVMGISFLGVGMILMTTVNSAFIGLSGIGVVSIIISVANRNKW